MRKIGGNIRRQNCPALGIPLPIHVFQGLCLASGPPNPPSSFQNPGSATFADNAHSIRLLILRVSLLTCKTVLVVKTGRSKNTHTQKVLQFAPSCYGVSR